MVKISAPFKDLKDVGVVVPNISSFNLPVWLLKKLERSWRMTIRPPQIQSSRGLDCRKLV